MHDDFQVETGLQLLARLNTRPILNDFYPSVFKDGLYYNEVVEIHGDNNTGKSFLLAELIACSILPREFGGKDAAAVLLNTDGNFSFSNLEKIMRYRISESFSSNGDVVNEKLLDEQINDIVKQKLQVYNVYNTLQLFASIYNLETILINYTDVSLVAIDTLTAFYWSEQTTKRTKMDLYLKKLLKTLQAVTKEHKTCIIFTRPAYFSSKRSNIEEANVEQCVKEPSTERINYSICLKFSNSPVDSLVCSNNYTAIISNYRETVEVAYEIDRNKINWAL